MLEVSSEIHCLRDPTRGGLATALNEIATSSRVGMVLEEENIPLREEVRGACELLGLDPLYSACEGRLVAIVGARDAASILARMQAHPLGRQARLVGRVVAEHPGTVVLRTVIGSERVVDMLSGAQLPRIYRNRSLRYGQEDLARNYRMRMLLACDELNCVDSWLRQREFIARPRDAALTRHSLEIKELTVVQPLYAEQYTSFFSMNHLGIVYFPMSTCGLIYDSWESSEGRDTKELRMRLEVRGQHIDVTEVLCSHATRRPQFALGRFRQRIARVAIYLTDLNGPRSGRDKHCRIVAKMMRGGAVSVEDVDADSVRRHYSGGRPAGTRYRLCVGATARALAVHAGDLPDASGTGIPPADAHLQRSRVKHGERGDAMLGQHQSPTRRRLATPARIARNR
jgi:hypothetical protein